MGASGWDYIVPYQPDINKALQELRQLVFEKGAYYKPAEFYQRILDIQPESLQEELKEEIERLTALPEPRSIDELLERNGLNGTHSIIDIERISAQPDIGAAWPLSRTELIELFGTDQPSREMVAEKEWAGILTEFRGSDEGLYVIVYQDGQPSEIFFCGYSGD